jgi:hypothetical protein
MNPADAAIVHIHEQLDVIETAAVHVGDCLRGEGQKGSVTRTAGQ